MELSKTAYVILGMLRTRAHTGYEIKSIVDHSTRFFWAASYGQIYPELRRLEEEGLVLGESDPQGGRQRTRYSLTPAGRERLRDWLLDPRAGYETRDEGLLKLFFASALDPDQAVEVVRAMRADRESVLAQLLEVERLHVAEGTSALVLDYGIGFHQWIVDWCTQTEQRLTSEHETAEVSR
jgi:PadR family transcriptional regulator AphA